MSATEVSKTDTTAAALIQCMRPRQWVKNLLVVAAPLAAGRLADPVVLRPTVAAVLSFVLASAAVYLLNDAVDVDADRLHPLKRHRPIAAGRLGVRAALAASGVLASLSLAVAALTTWPLLVVMVGYLGLQLAYATSLKHQPVLDIGVVASGFLLRAVAGGLAAGLPLSQWFLLVAGFGSLFIVAGKRYSELQTIGADAGTRRALTTYTESYLRFVLGVACGVTIMSYSLWAFQEEGDADIAWRALSIAPFVLALMRYAVDVDAGRAAEPEDIVLKDRGLQALGALWLALVLLGVTHG